MKRFVVFLFVGIICQQQQERVHADVSHLLEHEVNEDRFYLPPDPPKKEEAAPVFEPHNQYEYHTKVTEKPHDYNYQELEHRKQHKQPPRITQHYHRQEHHEYQHKPSEKPSKHTAHTYEKHEHKEEYEHHENKPTEKPHKHIEHNLEQHKYKDEHEYHQHYDDSDKKKPTTAKPKHDVHYKVSKPKALPDPPLVHQHHLETEYNRSSGVNNEDLFVPAGSDNLYYQRQGDDHLIYANAPNSIFHTQINVQSQSSEFNLQNSTPTLTGAGAGLAGAASNAVGVIADATEHRIHNLRSDYSTKRTGLSDEYDAGNFIGSATYQREYFEPHQETKPKKEPSTRKPKAFNEQGINVLNGNILGSFPPSLATFPRNDNERPNNFQGTNIINGNLFTSGSTLSPPPPTPTQPDGTMAAAVTHKAKDTQKSHNDEHRPKASSFDDIPDASSFEVIYKPGDQVDFTDDHAAAASFSFYDFETKDDKSDHKDTDLRQDGYHYEKPKVTFTF